MTLTDADHDLLTGLVSAHILDLNGQILRRADLTAAGRQSYARQIEAAYQTLRRLNHARAQQELAA